MNADCYWYTQKICETSTIYITIRNELAVKLVLQSIACKKCIYPYNYMLEAVKTSFFCTKNVGVGGQTKQLIDCSLSKIRMQDVERLLIRTDKLLCYTLMINFDEQWLIIGRLDQYGVDKFGFTIIIEWIKKD